MSDGKPPNRIWSRDTKTSRWHLSNYTVEIVNVKAITEVVADGRNLKDLVRWWLVEDNTWGGHLYEFKNDGERLIPLNWPLTAVGR